MRARVAAQDVDVDAGLLGEDHERTFGGVPHQLAVTHVAVVAQRADRREIQQRPGRLHDALVAVVAVPAISSSLSGVQAARTVIWFTVKRAGLVGADHRGAAERLDRRQLLHDRAPLGQPCSPDRQRQGDHGGEALGDRGDEQCHR